jgi:NADH:ubiquinone oxidoreductase subunit 3 (subunit A)
VGVILFGVRRGFREVDRTFSCGFEEIGHLLFWDSILLIIRFLIFEFEVVFIVLSFQNLGFIVLVAIFSVMVIEILNGGFGY